MVKAAKSRRLWQDFDWMLLGAALVLTTISLTEIYSATMNTPGGGNAYLIRQLAAVLVGLAGLLVIAAVDYHTIAEHIPWVYLGSIAVLVYTLLFGREHAGTKGWIQLGGGFGFQPAELIKIVVVVALARLLSELHGGKYMNLPQIVKVGVIFGVPVLLVMLQGDLGTALTFMPAFAFGLFVRGIRPRVLISLFLCFLMLLPLSWLFLKDYQKDRILTFIHPEMDPQGRGYQIIQSKIAIGSGGFWGKGLFEGSQNRLGFLPTRHTDFIFSVVGEELGFLGVMVTLGMFALILFRSLHSAQTARDNLGMFIIIGIVGIYFFHIVENVGMVIGFMPVTGVPLPFVSYGGSSVLSAFLALGLVINVRRCRYVN
jgi:rod shape determining protein RodA